MDDNPSTTRAPVPPAPQAFASAVGRAIRDRAVWLVAAAAFGVEMAVSGRYGYDRDELYFLAAGQHLALGVRGPAGADAAAGPGRRAADRRTRWSACARCRALGLAALVLLTGVDGAALGAGRGGQVLAALATACCAEYLGAMHELTTTPAGLRRLDVGAAGW